MKGNLGIAIILLAVFLSINSSGMEMATFSVAFIGLIVSVYENIVKPKMKK